MHPELLHLGPIVLPTYGAGTRRRLPPRRPPAGGAPRSTASSPRPQSTWESGSSSRAFSGPRSSSSSSRGRGTTSPPSAVSSSSSGPAASSTEASSALSWPPFFVKVKKVPFLAFADAAAPGVALGQAIGRIGCLAAGCCWGAQCTKPWAITFTNPKAGQNVGVPMGVPLHPTQLYEAVGLSSSPVSSSRSARAAPRAGPSPSTSSVRRSSASRYELFRGDPRGNVPATALSTSQGIAIGLFVLGLGILAFGRKRAEAPEEA